MGITIGPQDPPPTTHTYHSSTSLVQVLLSSSSPPTRMPTAPPPLPLSSSSSLLPAVSPDGNRKAIGRRVPSDSFAMAMALDLASSSAISRDIALMSFLAAASCPVAPCGRSVSRAATTVLTVVSEFERLREGRSGGGRSPTAVRAAVESLTWASGTFFRFDIGADERKESGWEEVGGGGRIRINLAGRIPSQASPSIISHV